MPIVSGDLKFFASAKMSDTADGGGARSSVVVQDGAANNVFPDVTPADRASGSARLRKVYPSVVSAASEPLLSMGVAINDDPLDPSISSSIFKFGDATTTRGQVESSVKASVTQSTGVIDQGFGSTSTAPIHYIASFTDGATIISISRFASLFGSNNEATSATFPAGSTMSVAVGEKYTLHKVISYAGQSGDFYEFNVAPPLPTPEPGGVAPKVRKLTVGRAYASVPTGAAVSAAAVALPLASLWTRVVPIAHGTQYPSGELGTGIGSEWARYTHGRLSCVEALDQAVLWDEQATAPATVANAQTVNTGRTDLAQLSVVDNDGGEIARFLKFGPAVAGAGCSADLAAGTVTFSDVSSYAQPVTVRHRIAEVVGIESLSGLTATLAAPLGRAYPAGSKLTTIAPYGDLEAARGASFSQQAWTKVFSDSVIGSGIAPLYNGAIGLASGGAETDRYAIVFKSATTFNLISEALGQIAAGNVASDFQPLSPVTGQPLFTLYAAGWASPGIGNVFRFNTSGTYVPLWVLRSVLPSAPGGNDRVVLRMTGHVNA